MSAAIVLSSSPPAPFARSPTAIDSSPIPSLLELFSRGSQNLKSFKSSNKTRDGFATALDSSAMTEEKQLLKPSVQSVGMSSSQLASELPKAKCKTNQAVSKSTTTYTVPLGGGAADKTGPDSVSSPVKARRPALQRRTDWSPIKEDSADCVFDLDDVADSATAFPKGLLAGFQHISSTKDAAEAGKPPDKIKPAAKRRKVEVRKQAAKEANAETKTPAREPAKAGGRKAMTITNLATSRYLGKDSIDEEFHVMPCHTSTQLREAGITDIDDLEVLLKKTPQRTRRKSSKKKDVAIKSTILSPSSALRLLDDQETIFGSASQLAQNNSTHARQDILSDPFSQDATQPISIGSTSPGTPCGGTSKYVRRRNLWAAAGRDEDNALLQLETDDPFELPPMRDAFAGKDALVTPLETIEPVLQRRFGTSALKPQTNSLSIPNASHTTILDHTRSSSQVIARVRNTRNLHTVVEKDKVESATSTIQMERAQHTLQDEPKANGADSDKAIPQKPSYAGVDTSVLQQRLKAYGFKPVKKREKVIELLDLCWEAKHGKQKAPEIQADAAKHGDFLSRVHDVSSRPEPKAKKVKAKAKTKAETDSSAKKPRIRKKAVSDKEEALVEPMTKTSRKSKPKTAVSAGEGTGGRVANPNKPEETSADVPGSPLPVKALVTQPGNGLDVADSTNSELSLCSQVEAAILHQSHHAGLTSRNHVSNPTWHEKILMYDPIIIEDLTSWLNTEGLNSIGEDRELSTVEGTVAMATSFARQLRTIALNSSHELDIRARRIAHAESLIFPSEVAVKQDWDKLYQICVEGYYELCQLDPRLEDFERNLFSEQSKEQDREQLNQSQNEALDTVITQCLQLLQSKLMLRPAVRCLEWLSRRFRIHVYNFAALLSTVVQYHEQQLFVNVLSLIPKESLVDTWKWLRPYKDVSQHVPRHAVVHAMTNNNGFCDTINAYVLQAAQSGVADKQLINFWGSLLVEAVAARLNRAKSGRREIQRQRTEDELYRLIPLLNDGLVLKDCPEIILACFTLSLVIASTGLLEDAVLDKMTEAVSGTLRFPRLDKKQVLITLSILAAQKEEEVVSSRCIRDLRSVEKFLEWMGQLRPQYPVHKLLYSVIQGCLRSLKKKTYEERLRFIQEIIEAGSAFIEQPELARWLLSLSVHLKNRTGDSELETAVCTGLIGVLRQLHDGGKVSLAFSEATSLAKEQGIDLEAILQTSLVIRKPEEQEDDSDDAMEVENVSQEQRRRVIGEHASTVESFLTPSPPTVFVALIRILKSYVDAGNPLDFHVSEKTYFEAYNAAYPSFLVRVVCGDRSSKQRCAAVLLLSRHVQEGGQKYNCKLLLPYLTSLLSDPAAQVRHAAVALAKQIAECGRKDGDEALLDVYASTHAPATSVLEVHDVTRIIEQVYLPVLAECELDQRQIGFALRHVLNGSPALSGSSAKHADLELKKGLRAALFQSLVDAVNANAMLSFRVSILKLLDGVYKVGSISKTEAFSNIVQSWLQKSEADASAAAESETLSLPEVDRAIASLISSQDKHSLGHILKIVHDLNYDIRSTFTAALFDRVSSEWKTLSEEAQTATAATLFDISFSAPSSFARVARSTIQKLNLSASTLNRFISDCVAITPSETDGPVPKRRRTSSGRAPPSQLAEALSSAMPRLVLTLELVEGSKPETKPELLPSLFDIMLVFRKLKNQSRPVPPYLVNVCLASINSIVAKQRELRRPSIELSVIRADIITDFARTTENPQVQASALQVLASLAALAPQRVIHNIMPVFTFMGSDVLSKNDEHSVNVVDQAIDYIIPPLIATFKKQDESSLIRATGGVLSSFVVAFDHIPGPRRVALYQRLLTRLGRRDFGFALIAMLVSQRAEDARIPSFIGDILKDFTAPEAIATYRSLVSLAEDAFSSKPSMAEQLTPITPSSSEDDKATVALALLEAAAETLDSKYVKTRVRQISKASSDHNLALQEDLRACLRQALQAIRDSGSRSEEIRSTIRQCLSNLLQLLPLVQLLHAFPVLLQEIGDEDEDLKVMALRLLFNQLHNKPPKDSTTAEAAIAFLSQLRSLIQANRNAALTHAAIQCIDAVVEVYGRKDVDALVDMAGFLAGEQVSIGSSVDQDIVLMLCLASMMDVMGDAAVPVASPVLHKALEALESLTEDEDESGLFNAICSALSAVLTHVSYMIDDDSLARLLTRLLEKEGSSNSKAREDMKLESLGLAAQKVEISVLVPILRTTWQHMRADGRQVDFSALLVTLGAIVRHHSKAEITKAADLISEFILQLFDTPEVQNGAELDGADKSGTSSQAVNEITIEFVYKLNDITFRPIFESWIEWAFAHHFFDTLKSIVTSYAAYLIPPATAILDSFTSSSSSASSAAGQALYTLVLSTLRSAFEHDADGFFANPSHFSPLASSLLASRTAAAAIITRTLVALASAVQDTPAHLLTLNHGICELRRAESAQVRAASISAQIALTESEDVGDEWISTVVSGAHNGEGDVAAGASSGETMIYVNEMLEDDDEQVEALVREWVRIVRERLGEDVFEF
ncbi:hypothetical protein DV738_g1940, partial [Chaetothyriales sp. CBS 135597]